MRTPFQQATVPMADDQSHPIPSADHGTELLANERTFLAWVRTSIAVISLGFAVTRFDLWFREMAQGSGHVPMHGIGWSLPMGLTMIAMGGLLSVFAAWRYHVVNRQIEQGSVRADRGMVILVVVMVVSLAMVFILYFLKSQH
ncbi:MAG: DUF202 domain-containing protein [Lysobacteraceae bacterium]